MKAVHVELQNIIVTDGRADDEVGIRSQERFPSTLTFRGVPREYWFLQEGWADANSN